MTTIKKINIFNICFATIKFIIFWVVVVCHMPIMCLIPTGKLSVKYMRFFMWGLSKISGVKIKVFGKLTDKRPLLCVCNHISVFEFVAMPTALGASFFGKNDIARYPVVGWIAKKFGVVFIDRRPSHVMTVLKQVQHEMQNVTYPMVIFPEGTTTNGAYVKDFKSSLFDILENSQITVQPIVMNYRYRNGDKISDIDMANHFAYFDNNKIEVGPKCEIERSAFGQVFHIMALGGFTIELYPQQPISTDNMDRKQIANKLHDIISTKYMDQK